MGVERQRTLAAKISWKEVGEIRKRNFKTSKDSRKGIKDFRKGIEKSRKDLIERKNEDRKSLNATQTTILR